MALMYAGPRAQCKAIKPVGVTVLSHRDMVSVQVSLYTRGTQLETQKVHSPNFHSVQAPEQ